ncbi:MAG TPA: disulfide bond formation protein B [Gammaproteobacteria bacterium]
MESRKQRRLWNAAGVAVAAALMGYALFAQHVQGYEPCPLCIYQRMIMIATGGVFLVAALHAPAGLGARAYGLLGALVALTGAGVAGWHVRLQHLPPEQVPACGPGLDYIREVFPLVEELKMVFTGSGECANIDWSFLGLSMPAWVAIWFALLAALAVTANWRRVPA